MKTIEQLMTYVEEQGKSDSGDPLITSIIIMGVLAVAAIAIFSAIANAMGERADEVSKDIANSGTHLR